MVVPSKIETRAAGSRPAMLVGVLLTLAVFVAGLLWAKWLPYAVKAVSAGHTHHWSGSDILGVGGVRAGDAPSWHVATSFFQAYVASIWQALVAALLISASVQSLIPPTWLPRMLNRRRQFTSALAGGLASMPSMMCTCCTAPVAVALRRSGVIRAAAVAYWLGNPLLNPAVLVFLLFVAPWQWTLTRLLVGAVTVVGGVTLVAALTRGRENAQPPATLDEPGTAESVPTARRFVQVLLRLCLVLLPEYLIMVLVVGACRGWLLTLTQPAHHGLLIVLLAAVVGTLVVIPTAGEIPILQGLALLGVTSGVLGALLITLPAVSLPGIAMVSRSFGWRTMTATTVMVIVAGLLGASVLSLL